MSGGGPLKGRHFFFFYWDMRCVRGERREVLQLEEEAERCRDERQEERRMKWRVFWGANSQVDVKAMKEPSRGEEQVELLLVSGPFVLFRSSSSFFFSLMSLFSVSLLPSLCNVLTETGERALVEERRKTNKKKVTCGERMKLDEVESDCPVNKRSNRGLCASLISIVCSSSHFSIES